MTFAFRGRIETNGSGGIIEYQWRTPDGQTSDVITAHVPPQTKDTAVSMQFTFTGSGPASGAATLHVLRPAAVYSAPVTVTYQCP